MAKPLSN